MRILIIFVMLCAVQGDRPTSQMSFLEQFLKETSTRSSNNTGATSTTAVATGSSSVGSDEGDDTHPPSSVPSLTSRTSYISQV